MTQASARSLTTSLDKLQISGSSKTQKRSEPVDSWEEEVEDNSREKGELTSASRHVVL